ncbi:hypothetical protein [Winogradskyella sp. 4-2091]|uniref:hypothetical protein n=1 Tax=Winogradskyella sp. 4-2091 TaxID=3381659 RepID=UPI003891CF7C
MNKYKLLGLGMLLDAIGMVSFVIPGFGEFTDIVWAPISALLMTKLYDGKAGKVAGVITLLEEGLPGLDIIPTFTIMWFYTYVFSAQKSYNKA